MVDKALNITLNLGSVLTLLVVNDAVHERNYGFIEIMYDPIFYIILVSGIGIALTTDNKDPQVEIEKPWKYFVYSFFCSVCLSALVVGAKIELQIGWLMFYGLIAVTTTLSPTIVRKLMTVLPDIFSEGIGGIFSSFFRWGASKYSNEKKEEGND